MTGFVDTSDPWGASPDPLNFTTTGQQALDRYAPTGFANINGDGRPGGTSSGYDFGAINDLGSDPINDYGTAFVPGTATQTDGNLLQQLMRGVTSFLGALNGAQNQTTQNNKAQPNAWTQSLARQNVLVVGALLIGGIILAKKVLK